MTISSPSDRWPRVEAVLDAVLALNPDARSAALDRLCGGDAEIRQEVESLLAADAAAEDFLRSGAETFAAPYLAEIDPDDPDGAVGERLGPYRIVREIGRGGMGAVYLAERADGQFEQQVAIKVIKRGMDTDEILARFRRERQILAHLQHSHMARLLDGGVTSDGRPYLVMEHVTGIPITRHCEAHGLSVESRLRLFQVVCRAVGRAHQSLVVHRDIKPSHVLVDDQGEVKLLDFGIAKLLQEDPERGAADITRAGSRFVTREYASPELLRGEPVGTASDVYQLGLLLYELLAGRPAYSFEGRNPAETERIICSVEPPRPSSVVAEEDARMARRLRGDLDTIVMTALRKEPERRYASAEGLADDVERHLTGQPLRAAPDSRLYRARKFARRHRVGLTATAAILILIAGFGGFYTLQMKRERDRARLEAVKATQSAEMFQRFFENWDPDAANRAEIGAGDLLRVSVLRTEREIADQPEIQAAMLSLLGGLYTNLGRLEEADSLLAIAETRQRSLREPSADLAATLERQGRLANVRGDYEAAEGAYREAIADYRSLFGPSNPYALQAQLGLADVFLQGQERFADAEALYREILDLHGDDPNEPSLVYADAARGLGLTLFYQARYGEAESILRSSLERNRRLFGGVHPVTVLTMQALAATVRDRGKVDEAVELQREVVRINRLLYGEDHRNTLFSKFVLAFNLHRQGRIGEAAPLIHEVVEWSLRRNGADHPQTGRYLRFEGYVLLDLGDREGAERRLRRALEIYREAYAHRHADEAGILNRLAYLLVERGASDAEPVYREAVAYHRELSAGSPIFVTYGPHYLAAAMARMGDPGGAEALYRRSLDLYRPLLPADHPYIAAAQAGLDEILRNRVTANR